MLQQKKSGRNEDTECYSMHGVRSMFSMICFLALVKPNKVPIELNFIQNKLLKLN